jgi:hypothetical protein
VLRGLGLYLIIMLVLLRVVEGMGHDGGGFLFVHLSVEGVVCI